MGRPLGSKNTIIRKDKGKCLEAEVKFCPRCKLTLPASDFHKTSEWAKRKRFAPWCKKCMRKWSREYAKSDKFRDSYFRKTYGITLKDYNNLLAKQNNCCAICGNQPDLLVVDHNHETQQIRGLLCHKCNLILGMCREDLQHFKNFIQYLEVYNGKTET